MRGSFVVALTLTALLTAGGPGRAARPVQKRENADYALVGPVSAVYVQETEGYMRYVVEMRVEQVEKGAGLRKGDYFRAFCYQRKPGKGGLEFDTAGHKAVPREGQRIRAFVNDGRGYHEGVYPDWFDVLPAVKR